VPEGNYSLSISLNVQKRLREPHHVQDVK